MELSKKILNNITIENFIILALITYICIFSIYTPRLLIRFMSNKFVVIFMIILMLVVFNINKNISILMVLALLVTIILNNNLVAIENKLKESFSDHDIEDYADGDVSEDDNDFEIDDYEDEVVEKNNNGSNSIKECFNNIENNIIKLKSILKK